jgi:predicted nucleic acid-binding protein
VVAEVFSRPYFDSSVFIAWLKGEMIKGVDRRLAADRLLRNAETGAYPATTSALTLAEVHKLRVGPSLPSEEDEQILRYFRQPFFEIVVVDRQLGEEANRLCRMHGIYPNDGIHLACAMRAGCDVLFAWDDRFIRVQQPGIRVLEPADA